MPRKSRYTVYASVYHLPPPDCRVKAPHIAVFDEKKRLVLVAGGCTVGEYAGRYSKSAARDVVAGFLNGSHTESFDSEDVHLESDEEVWRRIQTGKRGGFHIFILGQNVPTEETYYMKAIYRLELGNIIKTVSETLEFIRTDKVEDEEGLKQLICDYLRRKYRYHVESSEVHFTTENQVERMLRVI